MGTTWYDQQVPVLPDVRPEVLDPATSYQIVSMLQGVVERGTGTKAREVGKPLAGKTGTSNDSNDVWFVGFSPDLAVGVYVGFDQPRTLGEKETGGGMAAPIFRDFMAAALADQPAIPFRIPPGVRLVRVNAQTGNPAEPGDRLVILDAFKPGTEPFGPRLVLDGSDPVVVDEPMPLEEATGAEPIGRPPGSAADAATPQPPSGSTSPSALPTLLPDSTPSASGGLY